jgi:hypothetical protein
MISSKNLILLAVLLIGCVVATYINIKRAASGKNSEPQEGTTLTTLTQSTAGLYEAEPPTNVYKPKPRAPKPAPEVVEMQPVQPNVPQVIDPQKAYVASTLVGISTEANNYWHAAITSPSLSPNDRQTLIMNLAVAGFDDPPSEDDLPLIMSRIQILQHISQEPMDEGNAAAIAQTFEELVGMAEELSGE